VVEMEKELCLDCEPYLCVSAVQCHEVTDEVTFK
jgi:hypothetical protein